MLRNVEALLRALQTEHRLLGGDKANLSKNLETILMRFGDLIVPPDRYKPMPAPPPPDEEPRR